MERIIIEISDKSIAEKVINYLKKISGVKIIEHKKKKKLSKTDKRLLQMMLENNDGLADKKKISELLKI